MVKKMTSAKYNFEYLRVETIDEVRNVLYEFDKVFDPYLSKQTSDLDTYIRKICEKAIVFVIKEDDEYLGFIAFYANDDKNYLAYLTLIAVKPFAQKRKIGKLLLDLCIETSRKNGMTDLKLEVNEANTIATSFYKRNGFKFCGETSIHSKYMIKKL